MACTVCLKSDKQLKQLEDTGGWECSHLECPNRRKAWSEQVKVSRECIKHARNPIEDLLEKVRP